MSKNPPTPLKVVSLKREAATDADYDNHLVARVNDHVVRLSVMTSAFTWHHHPNSDETFLVTEGAIAIDLPDRSLVLEEGEMFTVPRGLRHRTRPIGARSVNITIEAGALETVFDEEDATGPM